MKNILLIILLFSTLVFISCSSGKSSNDSKILSYENIIAQDEIIINKEDKEKIIVNMIIEAKKQEEQRNYAKALIEYLNAIDINPTASIYYMAGNAYFELGKLENSKSYLKKSLQQNPDFEESLLKLIEIYIIEKDYKRAEVLTTEYARKSQDVSTMLKASSYFSKCNPQKAISILEDIYSNNKNEQIKERLLMLLYQLDEHEKYLDFYISDLDPNSSEIVQELLRILNYTLNINLSDQFMKILNYADNSLNEIDLINFYSSASDVILSRRFELAPDIIEMFIEKIKVNKFTDYLINLNLGIISDSHGKEKQAEKFFESAVKNYKGNSEDVESQLGYYYFYNEKQDKAKALLLKVNDKMKETWEDDYHLGHIYMSERKLDSSIYFFKKALEVESEKHFIYSDLGLIFDMNKMRDSAVYYYQQGLLLDSNNIVIMNNLAYTLTEQGENLDYALDLINKVMLKDSLSPNYLDTYGWLLFKLGNSHEALKYLIKANNLDSENSEIFYHLSVVYQKLGNNDKAKEFIDKAFKIAPDNKDIELLFKEINSP